MVTGYMASKCGIVRNGLVGGKIGELHGKAPDIYDIMDVLWMQSARKGQRQVQAENTVE